LVEQSEYIAISQLFDVIGIIEKGIEKIYHHLLKNDRIENLEEVSKQYKLTLKRGYKICAVLNNLELVQIFDRPMKIHLNPDLIPIWQKLIVKRIEELNIEFQEKKEKCESALEAFFQTYNVKEVVQSQEPVEFVNYTIERFDDMYYPFLAKNECRIAIGIRYENPLLSIIKADMLSNPPEDKKPFMVAGMRKVQENLKNIDVQVIFHGELARYFLTSKELEILSDHLGKIDPPLEFKSFEVHITEEPFSNFSLTDDALIQPSFDPSNKLIGAYISRNKNIFPIFYDKFNEIFKNGIPINDFMENERDVNITSLSNEQLLAMCLL
jgi:hypothetical protein